MKTTMIAATAALLIGTTGLSAADFTVRYSTFGAPTSPIPQCNAFPMLEEIKEMSDGRIDYETYMGGTAFANPVKQFEQVARGVMDISEGPLTYTPGRFALTELVTLPFLMTDNVAGSIAITRLAEEYLAEEFEDIHLMGIILTSPYQLHMSKPVVDMTDLGGLRLRTSGAGMTGATDAFGGVPTGMPLPDAYEAMQRGVIDGTVAPWTAVAAFKLHEVSSQHIVADLGVGLTFVGMSKKFLASLPPDLQELMKSEFMGDRIARRGAECFLKVDKVAIRLAGERGNEIVTLTEKERAAAAEKLRPLIEELIADVEAKGKAGRAFHDALVAEIAEVEAELANE